MTTDEIKLLGPISSGYSALYSQYNDLFGLHVTRHYILDGEQHTRCLLGLDHGLVDLIAKPQSGGSLAQCQRCSNRLKLPTPKHLKRVQYNLLRRALGAPLTHYSEHGTGNDSSIIEALERHGLLRWVSRRKFEITDLGRNYVATYKEVYNDD